MTATRIRILKYFRIFPLRCRKILATAKFVKKAFYKNNAPVVYLFVLHRLAKKCTKIYKACKTIVRLIRPFVLRLFRCRCGLYKVHAVVVYKKSRIRHISVLFASIFAI